ncbi:MAG: amidohydrolase family protein [Proteobacteria bacterium]|nr:amidohydrolase family protein [Pseudomonadota bacterium]
MAMQDLIVMATCVLAANAATASSTAFVNVNIVPMTSDTIVTQQSVIVTDASIVAIGDVDTIPVPEDAWVVDGTDRYLMPGLTEMHAHVPEVGSQDLDRVMTLFVANGVTAIRGMLGRPSHLALRQQLADGDAFGPRLITSGPSMNGESVSGVADAMRKVRAQHAAGYDFIKIHPGLSPDEFSVIAAVSTELGMRFAGHVPVAVGVDNALAAGIATIDHLDGYFVALLPANIDPSGGYGGFFDVLLADQVIEERIAGIAARTAAAGTWNVPTESLFENRVSPLSVTDLRNRPEMRFMPEATVNRWVRSKETQERERGFNADIAVRAIEIRRRLILALHEAGAGLLLGSDAPQVFNVPGFSLHHELEILVAAGLTPFEALQTGTAAAGKFLETNTGTVAIGRNADLVLLDANPLEDIGNTRRIHGVMLRGSWYSSSDLEQRLSVYRRQDD